MVPAEAPAPDLAETGSLSNRGDASPPETGGMADEAAKVVEMGGKEGREEEGREGGVGEGEGEDEDETMGVERIVGMLALS